MQVLVKIANAGTTSMQGLDITIENRAGELRHGKDWVQRMAHDYGYINDTVGADGDGMDVFIGPNPDADSLYTVEQQNESGKFDEHKIMAGFSNISEAKDAYHANYPKGWDGMKNISEVKNDEFWGWYEGLAGNKNAVVTKKAKDLRKKLVSDMEGYAGDPDFATTKENSMEDTYKFGNHNQTDLTTRGKNTYGSKVDNSVCECPVCFGGKRLGMFACKNCKGEGIVRNAKEGSFQDIKERIMECDSRYDALKKINLHKTMGMINLKEEQELREIVDSTNY